MRRRASRSLAFTPLLLAFSVVAAAPQESSQKEVAQRVDQRIHQPVRWNRGTREDAEAQQRVRELLKAPLTLDGAVQVALLNNAKIQATFEELGIAQADLVQAGLLRNPTFGAGFLRPQNGGGAKTEFSLTQELIDLFTRPLRKRVAAAQLEQAKLRVAEAILELYAGTKSTFFTVQASQQQTAMRRTILDSAEASQTLSLRQYQAGNISLLVFDAQTAFYEQTRLDLARSQAQLLVDREQLTRLLGLWGAETDWKIEAKLDEIPGQEIALDRLESLAIGQRLDLLMAEKDSQILSEALNLSRKTRWFGSVQVGAASEKESDGSRVLGPTLSVELPLFDRHQASIARLEAQFRQNEGRVAHMAVAIRSEVRVARDRMRAARDVVDHYRKVLIPLRERIVQESQLHYNGMLIGVYELVQAKQAKVGAYREYIEAVRDYWIARADLERAVGGSLNLNTPPTPSNESGKEQRP